MTHFAIQQPCCLWRVAKLFSQQGHKESCGVSASAGLLCVVKGASEDVVCESAFCDALLQPLSDIVKAGSVGLAARPDYLHKGLVEVQRLDLPICSGAGRIRC